MTSAPSRLPALDGLRALAILLVLAGHALDAAMPPPHPLWTVPFTNASLGVRLFFVLSGYLITSLLMKEQAAWGKVSLRLFYLRRFLRIFPAFYLYLGVVLLLGAGGWVEFSGRQLLGAATYTWNYLGLWHPDGPLQGRWFFGHLWTLSLEEQFYLLWPGFIVLAGWRAARRASLLIPLVLPGVRVACYLLYPGQRGLLGMMFHTAIDSILIGCAFALWEDRLPRWIKEGVPALVAAGLYCFLVSPYVAHALKGGYSLTAGFGLDGLCAGVLVLQARRPGNWRSFLSVHPLAYIGTLSYSLYLWQQVFLTRYNSTPSGRFPVNLIAALLCAMASYHLMERPILSFKRRFERAEGGPPGR